MILSPRVFFGGVLFVVPGSCALPLRYTLGIVLRVST